VLGQEADGAQDAVLAGSLAHTHGDGVAEDQHHDEHDDDRHAVERRQHGREHGDERVVQRLLAHGERLDVALVEVLVDGLGDVAALRGSSMR
jgi:Ni/Co efflux regulator RcnB